MEGRRVVDRYAIILDDPDQENAEKTIRKAYPEAHKINAFVFLVRDTNTTGDITEAIGMDSSANGIGGLVVRMDAWSGYTYGSTWEWLEKGKS